MLFCFRCSKLIFGSIQPICRPDFHSAILWKGLHVGQRNVSNQLFCGVDIVQENMRVSLKGNFGIQFVISTFFSKRLPFLL